MTKLDPRRHPFRDDLAAESLRGVVDAERYVQGDRRQVAASAVPLRREPHAGANLDTEALHGETMAVFDERDGWAWVQLDHDGYVGYVPSEGLGPVRPPTTHRIAALRTYVFPEPDAKAPPLRMLSLNARVCVTEEGVRYARLDSGGFVYGTHLAPIGRHEPDFVADVHPGRHLRRLAVYAHVATLHGRTRRRPRLVEPRKPKPSIESQRVVCHDLSPLPS